MSLDITEGSLSDEEIFFGKLTLKEVKKRIFWDNQQKPCATSAFNSPSKQDLNISLKILQTTSEPNLLPSRDRETHNQDNSGILNSGWDMREDDSFIKLETMVEKLCVSPTPDNNKKTEELNNTLEVIEYILNNPPTSKNKCEIATDNILENVNQAVKTEDKVLNEYCLKKLHNISPQKHRKPEKASARDSPEPPKNTPVKGKNKYERNACCYMTPVENNIRPYRDAGYMTPADNMAKLGKDDDYMTSADDNTRPGRLVGYMTPVDNKTKPVKDAEFMTPAESKKVMDAGYMTPADNKTKPGRGAGYVTPADNKTKPVFKTPGQPLSLKKPSATSLKKTPSKTNAYQHISSPVASYIKNCPIAPLVKDVHPKKPLPGPSSIPKLKSAVPVKQSNKENVNLPSVAYKSAKKTKLIEMPEEQKLPESQWAKKIMGSLPRPVVIKHGHRELNFAKRKLLPQQHEDSFANLSYHQAEVSVCTQKSAFNLNKNV